MVSRNEPSAPSGAASVGAAHPRMMEPSTAKIIRNGGTSACAVIHSLRESGGSSGPGGTRGPYDGLMAYSTKMYTRYRLAMIRPGKIMPTSRSPTETSATGPSTTTTTEGGMMVPSEPPAQMVPQMSGLWYEYLSIAGMASRPTTVSVAPMTPVEAAKITHMPTVPSARPPGKRRVQRCTASNSSSAMPERSSIVPMKTNSGTAASTKFDAMSSTLSMNWKITAPLNTSQPKTSAVPESA